MVHGLTVLVLDTVYVVLGTGLPYAKKFTTLWYLSYKIGLKDRPLDEESPRDVDPRKEGTHPQDVEEQIIDLG